MYKTVLSQDWKSKFFKAEEYSINTFERLSHSLENKKETFGDHINSHETMVQTGSNISLKIATVKSIQQIWTSIRFYVY